MKVNGVHSKCQRQINEYHLTTPHLITSTHRIFLSLKHFPKEQAQGQRNSRLAQLPDSFFFKQYPLPPDIGILFLSDQQPTVVYQRRFMVFGKDFSRVFFSPPVSNPPCPEWVEGIASSPTLGYFFFSSEV